MATILIKKRDTTGAPAAGDLTNSTGGAEIAVNTADKRLYTKDSGGNVVEVGINPTTVTTTQVDITAQGDLRLQDTTGGQYVALQAPGTIATSFTLTLPADDGNSGQVLTTDGSGVLSWSNAAAGDVTLTGTQTLTNKTLTDPAITGTILEDIFTISDGAAFEIDPGNGSVQLITLGASRTPKATNFAAGESVLLMVDDGTAYTLTWTDSTFGGSGVVWKTNAGVAPTLNTSGYTAIVLWKVSTQVYGARVGDA